LPRREAVFHSSGIGEQAESRIPDRISPGADSLAGTGDTSCRTSSEPAKRWGRTTLARWGSDVNERSFGKSEMKPWPLTRFADSSDYPGTVLTGERLEVSMKIRVGLLTVTLFAVLW
jgi:hypothetical protein